MSDRKTNVRVSFEVPYDDWPGLEPAFIKLLPRGALNVVIRDGIPYVPARREKMSVEGLRKLETTIEQFIDEHQVSCGESAYQVDKINEAAPELLIAVADIVGYYKDPDEQAG
jgi:hypothetical protein